MSPSLKAFLELKVRALAVSRRHGSACIGVELFAGIGGISDFLERKGFGMIRVELLNGIDACCPLVLNALRGLISSGVVVFLWCGTPCSTWSQCRRDINGAGPRSRGEHIFGKPNLSTAENARLKLGNATMKVTARVLTWCLKSRTCAVLENPVNSLLWHAPPISHIVFREGRLISLDYCCYGTRWRKRTRFWTYECGDVDRLCLRCTGRRVLCSVTNKPHIQITGYCPVSKQRMSKVAEPYPKRLSSAWSSVIHEALNLHSLHIRFDKFTAMAPP